METVWEPNYERIVWEALALKRENFNRAENRRKFQSTIWEVLEKLPPRSRYVLSYRYGFNDEGIVLTNKELGKRMNVTGQRVRQLEFKALLLLHNLLLAETKTLPATIYYLPMTEGG